RAWSSSDSVVVPIVRAWVPCSAVTVPSSATHPKVVAAAMGSSSYPAPGGPAGSRAAVGRLPASTWREGTGGRGPGRGGEAGPRGCTVVAGAGWGEDGEGRGASDSVTIVLLRKGSAAGRDTAALTAAGHARRNSTVTRPAARPRSGPPPPAVSSG